MSTGDSYSGFAELYHRHLEITGRDDVAFYVNLARQADGPVLELGCGTGRTLIPCARAGAKITGLDLSEEMLGHCKSLLEKESPETGSNVTLVQGDMAEFRLGRKYRLITTPFRPFQHLATVEEQLSCLRCVREHLEHDGTFVLDIFDPDMEILTDYGRAEEFGEEPPFPMPDGTQVTVSYRNPSVDEVNQIVHCEMIFTRGMPGEKQERHVQEFIMRYTFRWEAEHLLHRAGFHVEELLGGYEGEPVGTGELVFICSLRQAGTR